MSSSPTDLTSTTGSSTSSPSPTDETTLAVVACGAIAQPLEDIARRRGWPVSVHPLPPLLHHHPARIAGEGENLRTSLRQRFRRVAIGYADCGTYGALDELCRRSGAPRLGG